MAWMRFRKKEIPGGLWLKCPACGEVIYKKDLEENAKVCPKCDHHHTMNALERVAATLDEGTAEEFVADMEAMDRLEFQDKTPYTEKLKKTMEKTKRKEAMWIGRGKILGRDVAFGTLDFSFLGGSMGVVVGEKVALIAEYALEHDRPLVLVAASGGARMHEGALSLMQMAKTCTVLGRFDSEGKLYIAVLANPTTGGVTASWATQADVVIAEPGALIGFAGPRVIKTTIRQDLPEGFQRSEFLVDKGQIDLIVPRPRLRETLHTLIEYCVPAAPAEAPAPPAEAARKTAAEKAGDKPSRPKAAASSGNNHKGAKSKNGRNAKPAARRKTPDPDAPAKTTKK